MPPSVTYSSISTSLVLIPLEYALLLNSNSAWLPPQKPRSTPAARISWELTRSNSSIITPESEATPAGRNKSASMPMILGSVKTTPVWFVLDATSRPADCNVLINAASLRPLPPPFSSFSWPLLMDGTWPPGQYQVSHFCVSKVTPLKSSYTSQVGAATRLKLWLPSKLL